MLTTILKIPYLRLKYKFLPNNGQKFWAQELLNSQGLSAKLGQVLGQGKKTELPKSSITVAQAKKIFNREFQKEIIFTGEVHAASMGQVFFVDIEGHKFAIKILHPGIKETIRKEIDNILILGKHFAKSKGFNFEEGVFKRFLTEVFEEETDLKRESQFQKQFHRLFKDDKRFKISEVFDEYSNASILCQELTLSTLAKDLDKIDHFFIFNFFFESLFNHGILHGDLNDRNWGISNEGLVVIYDFGCSQIISERRINGFKKLLTNKDIINGFKEFGIRLEATYFKGKEQELRDALFNPLLNHEISPNWSISQELQDKYQDKIKSLREYTDPWVLLMMRSLFSLIKFYQSRNLGIPLGKIISPYLEIKAKEFLSTEIKIEVLEDGKQVIYMTLPISAIDNLHNLMPEKVSNKIDESRIDLKEITKKVKDSQFSPQDLFSLMIEKRSYKVWIE
jgi:predicted unusual protein kinase regulating ubiquinone biosynthesis (AarF/ABC1/UbiB family)